MFSASKLNTFMLEAFIKHAQSLNSFLEKKQKEQAFDSGTVNMQEIFLRYTMDAVSCTHKHAPCCSVHCLDS
jgi:hypothetical protein